MEINTGTHSGTVCRAGEPWEHPVLNERLHQASPLRTQKRGQDESKNQRWQMTPREQCGSTHNLYRLKQAEVPSPGWESEHSTHPNQEPSTIATHWQRGNLFSLMESHWDINYTSRQAPSAGEIGQHRTESMIFFVDVLFHFVFLGLFIIIIILFVFWEHENMKMAGREVGKIWEWVGKTWLKYIEWK